MRRIALTTFSLTALTTAATAAWLGAGWCAGLWLGAVWGLANTGSLGILLKFFTSPRRPHRGWVLTGLVLAKLLGLYGLLLWFLVGARVSPMGWLAGFTLSLAGLGVAAVGSPRPLAVDR